MKPSPNELTVPALSALATQKLAKLAGKTFTNVTPSAEDYTADGDKVFLFIATPPDDPNGKSFSVALTASGKELNAADAGKLFLPHLSIDPSLLIAIPRASEHISISPTENNLTLKECEVFNEVITVTVPKNPKRKVDVYFLADSTGSMGAYLNAVKTGATNILNSLVGLGQDLAYGVGNYKDFKSPLPDPYAFQNQLSPSANPSQAAVAAAMNTWTASGGGDTPEAQLYALDQLSNPLYTAGIWRPGAKRIIVWFGDAPGHDPICNSVGAPYKITELLIKNNVAAGHENITVLAINVTGGQLDGDPRVGCTNYTPFGCNPDLSSSAGQATRIANASPGGSLTNGVNTATIVNTIINLINAAVSVINNISLKPTGCVASFVTSIDPAAGYGPLSGDLQHVLKFNVTFTGTRPCDDADQNCYGSIDVVADGVVVAAKKVHIKVPACCKRRNYSYNVKFVIGRQEKQECNTRNTVNPGLYATEINILNYQNKKASIRKHIIPLVEDQKVIGREPHYSKIVANDSIVLPPYTATMDDSFRICQLLFTTPPCNLGITIGYLMIVSNIPLTVTAVYTASTLEGVLASMDVEEIQPKEIPVSAVVGRADIAAASDSDAE